MAMKKTVLIGLGIIVLFLGTCVTILAIKWQDNSRSDETLDWVVVHVPLPQHQVLLAPLIGRALVVHVNNHSSDFSIFA